jgi:hypothetical protein
MKTYPIPANLIFLFLPLVFFISASAQQPSDSSTHSNKAAVDEGKKISKFEPSAAVMFMPVYTAQFPFGNMADRFGFNSLFGMQIGYKTRKNWLVAGEGNFLFGTHIKESYILDNIATSTGQFITQSNDLTDIRAQEQGFSLKFSAGKLVPLVRKFPDAGLLFITSIGFLQHKIAINVRESSLPQLNKTYRKGYDRMSNGPVISQFIGGIFMGRRRFLNAYAGFQFDAGFTQDRRPFDFYAMRKLDDKRIDLFVGIRVGWILPLFMQASEKEYYYY